MHCSRLTWRAVVTKPSTIQVVDKTLSLQDLHPNPTAQFLHWLQEARAEPSLAHDEPEICTLSTAELPSGRVSTRTIQLKGLGANGSFIFFINFGTSRKSADLATNSHVGLNFFWGGFSQRQVRVEGTANKLPDEESNEYFKRTSKRSRIASWASPQSEVLTAHILPTPATSSSREDDGRVKLDTCLANVEERFKDCDDIPMPPTWGVLEVVPITVEFWQGRANRLHDRFVYEWKMHQGSSEDSGCKWVVSRVCP